MLFGRTSFDCKHELDIHMCPVVSMSTRLYPDVLLSCIGIFAESCNYEGYNSLEISRVSIYRND